MVQYKNFRDRFAVADSTYKEVSFDIPDGWFIQNVRFEWNTPFNANADNLYLSVGSLARSAIGTPMTAGTIAFRRPYLYLATSGMETIQTHHDIKFFNELLDKGEKLFCGMYNSVGDNETVLVTATVTDRPIY